MTFWKLSHTMPFLQWLPSPVGSKPESSPRPTGRRWLVSSTRLPDSFHSHRQTHSALQPGRLCTGLHICCSLSLEPSSPRNPHGDCLTSWEPLLLRVAVPNHPVKSMFTTHSPFWNREAVWSSSDMFYNSPVYSFIVHLPSENVPQEQGHLNALIITICLTPRTVPGTWQVFKKIVEK